MIFRLKTSKRTQEIFHELENRTNYKPYTLWYAPRQEDNKK